MGELTDRERWDAKYENDAVWRELRPADSFVTEMVGRVEALGVRGRAVDLAGGAGRHALELARRGWEATVWDVSPVGLERARRFAEQAGIALETHVVDVLTERPLAAEPRFDLAVIVNFRDRELVDELPRIVRPGGYVVYVHYTTEWPEQKPPMRFRLQPKELASGLPGLELVEYREQDGRAGALCRLPSVEG